jgi:hypothetical protein
MSVVRAGTKLQEAGIGAEGIVIKPPSEAVLVLAPGGQAILGKRYVCVSCRAEVLVTKGGDGQFTCHDAAMTVAEAKKLPSSD